MDKMSDFVFNPYCFSMQVKQHFLLDSPFREVHKMYIYTYGVST